MDRDADAEHVGRVGGTSAETSLNLTPRRRRAHLSALDRAERQRGAALRHCCGACNGASLWCIRY
jgi:hypothetical protein